MKRRRELLANEAVRVLREADADERRLILSAVRWLRADPDVAPPSKRALPFPYKKGSLGAFYEKGGRGVFILYTITKTKLTILTIRLVDE